MLAMLPQIANRPLLRVYRCSPCGRIETINEAASDLGVR
jgi:hypothetical protein